MTYQHPRMPYTPEDAIQRVIDAIGKEALAKALGRSVSLIQKWSSPFEEVWPNVVQAVEIDCAYRMAGHDGAPILEYIAASIEDESGSLDCLVEDLDLREAVMKGAADLGRLAEQVTQALKDNRISDDERNGMLGSIQAGEANLRDMRRALMQGRAA